MHSDWLKTVIYKLVIVYGCDRWSMYYSLIYVLTIKYSGAKNVNWNFLHKSINSHFSSPLLYIYIPCILININKNKGKYILR